MMLRVILMLLSISDVFSQIKPKVGSPTVRPSKLRTGVPTKKPFRTSKTPTSIPSSLRIRTPSRKPSSKTISPSNTPSTNKDTFGPTFDSVSNALTTVKIPSFSIELDLNTTIGLSRQLQTNTSQSFSEDYLIAIHTQVFLATAFKSLTSTLVYVRLISTEPSIIHVGNHSTNWIASNFSGYASFQGNAPSSKDLGNALIQAFHFYADSFIETLHSTNNSNLLEVKKVHVHLLVESNEKSQDIVLYPDQQQNNTTTSIPYIVVGSTVSIMIVFLSALWVYKKKRGQVQSAHESQGNSHHNIVCFASQPLSTLNSTYIRPAPTISNDELNVRHNLDGTSLNEEDFDDISEMNLIQSVAYSHDTYSLDRFYEGNNTTTTPILCSLEEASTDEDESEISPPGMHYFPKTTITSGMKNHGLCCSSESESLENREEFFIGILGEPRPYDEFNGMTIE